MKKCTQPRQGQSITDALLGLTVPQKLLRFHHIRVASRQPTPCSSLTPLPDTREIVKVPLPVQMCWAYTMAENWKRIDPSGQTSVNTNHERTHAAWRWAHAVRNCWKQDPSPSAHIISKFVNHANMMHTMKSVSTGLSSKSHLPGKTRNTYSLATHGRTFRSVQGQRRSIF